MLNFSPLFIFIVCLCSPALQSDRPQAVTEPIQQGLLKQEKMGPRTINLFKFYEQRYNEVPSGLNMDINPNVKYNLNDVILWHPLPSVMIAGQYFMFEGQINPIQLFKLVGMGKIVNKKYFNLLFVLKSVQSSKLKINSVRVPIDSKRFLIQQKFADVGPFYFGIFLQEVGLIEKIIRVVEKPLFAYELDQLRTIKTDKRMNIQMQISDNQFVIKWTPTNPISRIIISQANRSIIFTISNNKGFFKLPLSQFDNFTQMETKLQIQDASSAHLTSFYQTTDFSRVFQRTFFPTRHLYMDRNYDLIQFIPNKVNNMVSLYDQFNLTGFCAEEIQREALIIKPDGSIEEISINFDSEQINSDNIPPFTKFQLSFMFEQNGTYVLEINHKQGFAVLNMPLYCGTYLPLLPDPIDFGLGSEKKTFKNIENLVEVNLNEINHIRQAYKRRRLDYSKELSDLASGHNKDMIEKNYISHINKQQLSPRNRAQKVGIFSRIGQNIIVDDAFENLQKKLNRSPLHLRNTLDSSWSRVGIGLDQDSKGMFYLTQQFSNQQSMVKNNQFFIKMKYSFLQLVSQLSNITVIENTQLSNEINKMKVIQSPLYLASIKQFLFSQGIKSAKLISISAPIYVEFKDFIKKTESSKLIPIFGRKNVGLSIKEQKGFLKINAIFY